MPLITLKKFLRKDAGLALSRLLLTLDEPVAVLDLDGSLQSGVAPPAAGQKDERIPVMYEGEQVAWVLGEKTSKWKYEVAGLLSLLLIQENEKRALAAEVLDKYRELHMLYRLSEKLVAFPQPDSIGQMALKEVCALAPGISGMVLLINKVTHDLEVVASCGRSFKLKTFLGSVPGLINQVLEIGSAQLFNERDASEFFEDIEDPVTDHHVSLLCAPLKTEKEVFGLMLLVGDPGRSFNAGELKLLNAIAMQTAPAIEVAQLHQIELQNARLERDLQTAHRVQSGLLPRKMPILKGWRLAAHWQPAHVVSGDLYDFISFPDGRIGLVIADVTDKGVPAALLMANTRSVMRGAAASLGTSGSDSPGKLLTRVNQVLCEDMPENMFVTCLLAILDPDSGHIRYANAGHNPPYLRSANEVLELRARGVPLGVFPESFYEEKEAVISTGESLLMYSDGLVEAHDPQGDMFGTGRLVQLLKTRPGANRLEGEAVIEHLMAALARFTGSKWVQEDDVTLVTLNRFG